MAHSLSTPAPPATASPSRLLWPPLLLLCLIAAAAAARRIFVLISPPATAPTPDLALLDTHFAAHATLTLSHIIPAALFVLLIPPWLSQKLSKHPATHRRITYALFTTGAITGITALFMARRPIGGINESAASILYGTFFLVSLARAVWLYRSNIPLHREWMMRAIAILLGIATTRPIMGIFFATQRLTHLTPQQFFGTAFWIGFTTTYIAGEAYLRTHKSPSTK
jgi:hypothetical protein